MFAKTEEEIEAQLLEEEEREREREKKLAAEAESSGGSSDDEVGQVTPDRKGERSKLSPHSHGKLTRIYF